MSAQITPQIQNILDEAENLDEVVSIEVQEVPRYLLSQVGNGKYVYFLIKLKLSNGCIVEAGFVVPEQVLDEDTSYFVGGIKELAECGCTRIGENQDAYCVDNPFYNRGKAAYLIRYPDMYQVKLEDEMPEIIVLPHEEMTQMVNKLKQLDKVKEIVLEKIIDQRLLEENGEDAIMVDVNITVDKDPTYDHWVSFVAPKSVWDNEMGHEWAIENLKNTIEQNNA